jgi:hypothetical protein
MTANGPRIFTIAEVDALIPQLSALVGRQLLSQSEIERDLAELARVAGGLPRSLEPDTADSDAVVQLKCELRARIAEYEAGWSDVQALGAVIKDPRIGLVDFYGRIDGKVVCLCWRYGEECLGYYHELDAGYAGRRPLGAGVRDRLLN